MFKKAKAKQLPQSVNGVGRLHVHVEYTLDAQFISELLDTGFDSYNRFVALASGLPDPGPRGATDGEIAETESKS